MQSNKIHTKQQHTYNPLFKPPFDLLYAGSIHDLCRRNERWDDILPISQRAESEQLDTERSANRANLNEF